MILLLGGMTAIMFVPGAQAVTQDVMHPGLRHLLQPLRRCSGPLRQFPRADLCRRYLRQIRYTNGHDNTAPFLLDRGYTVFHRIVLL